jgi:hypothetical protein
MYILEYDTLKEGTAYGRKIVNHALRHEAAKVHYEKRKANKQTGIIQT